MLTARGEPQRCDARRARRAGGCGFAIGCDAAVAERVLSGDEILRPSENDFDWLGSGVYFWEFAPERALEFAHEQQARGRIREPAIIGAVIQLGVCLDLLDSRNTRALGSAFKIFAEKTRRAGLRLPRNGGRTPDRLLRRRDCAVVNWLVEIYRRRGLAFDAVRGGFREGRPAFPGSGIYEKTHIQIAVRNVDCVIGVFRPLLGGSK